MKKPNTGIARTTILALIRQHLISEDQWERSRRYDDVESCDAAERESILVPAGNA